MARHQGRKQATQRMRRDRRRSDGDAGVGKRRVDSNERWTEALEADLNIKKERALRLERLERARDRRTR